MSELTIRDTSDTTQQKLTAAPPAEETRVATRPVHRERGWTIAVTEAAARERGTDPESQLLAVFDLLEEWYQSDDADSASFLEVLVDLERDNRRGRADTPHLGKVREAIARLAREAELPEPDAFALEFHVLLKASILSALEGDTLAGVRAREMGRELLARHRSRALAREAGSRPGSTFFGDAAFDLYDSGSTREVAGNTLIDWYDDVEFDDRTGD